MAKPKQEGRIKRRRAWLLSALASRANVAHHHARRFARMSALMAKEAGDALLRAKNLVDKGGWGGWLTANFDGSQRTAQVYMRLSRHWRELVPDARKGPPLSQREAIRALQHLTIEHVGLDGVSRRPRRVSEPEGLFDDPLKWRPIPARGPEGCPRVINLAIPRLTELARLLAANYAPSDRYGGTVIEAILRLRDELWRRRPREELLAP